MADMNTILNSLDGLSSLPQTVFKVTSMLASGDPSSAEIEKVVRIDEAVSITVLRWANSATYGRPGRTFTLREGISRLGNANLMKIILQQKTASMFARAGVAFDLQRGALWRSATGGALAAQTIGKSVAFDNPDLAFLCALLRDVGKLALDAHYGHAYADTVIAHFRPDRTFIDAEREAFGFDHAQLGSALAQRWNLPERIVRAIAFHHNPPPPGPDHDTLFDIVHAADIVCLWAGLAIGCDGLQYQLAEHVRLGLNLTRPSAEHLIASTWDALRTTETLMGEPVPMRASA
jgi:HD-like signal output (HDOD) protein